MSEITPAPQNAYMGEVSESATIFIRGALARLYLKLEEAEESPFSIDDLGASEDTKMVTKSFSVDGYNNNEFILNTEVRISNPSSITPLSHDLYMINKDKLVGTEASENNLGIDSITHIFQSESYPGNKRTEIRIGDNAMSEKQIIDLLHAAERSITETV